jgi:hypothetical protein
MPLDILTNTCTIKKEEEAFLAVVKERVRSGREKS